MIKSLLHSFLKKWHCDFHNILSEYKSLYFVFEAWNKHMWHRNIPYKVILTIIKLTVNIGTKDTLCYRIQFRSGSKKNVSFHAFWITQIMARKNFLYMRWLAKHKIWIKFCNNLLSMCCLTFSFFFCLVISYLQRRFLSKRRQNLHYYYVECVQKIFICNNNNKVSCWFGLNLCGELISWHWR